MNVLPAADRASQPAVVVLLGLGTSAEVGLDGAEARRRLDEVGPNVVESRRAAARLGGRLRRRLRRR